MELAGLRDPKDILDMSADEIIAVQKKLCVGPGSTCVFGPVADDVVIPSNWQELINSTDYWKGRAIVGSCRNEVAYYRFMEQDFLAAAPRIARELFGVNGEIAQGEFEELAEKMGISEDREAQEGLWVKLLSDYMYRTYSQRLALSLSRNGSQVWWYTMEFGNAIHCQDQSMAFDHPLVMQMMGNVTREDAETLAEQIYESYARFFEFGDPNGKKIPQWPQVDPAHPRRMVWDTPVRVEMVRLDDVLNSFPNFVYKL